MPAVDPGRSPGAGAPATAAGADPVGWTDLGGEAACYAHLLCPGCDAVIPEDAARCPSCGTPVRTG